jgi:hypothetical protein
MSNPAQKPPRSKPPSQPDRDITPRPERDTPDKREYGGSTPSRDRDFGDEIDRERDRNRDVERERDDS